MSVYVCMRMHLHASGIVYVCEYAHLFLCIGVLICVDVCTCACACTDVCVCVRLIYVCWKGVN